MNFLSLTLSLFERRSLAFYTSDKLIAIPFILWHLRNSPIRAESNRGMARDRGGLVTTLEITSLSVVVWRASSPPASILQTADLSQLLCHVSITLQLNGIVPKFLLYIRGSRSRVQLRILAMCLLFTQGSLGRMVLRTLVVWLLKKI